MHEFIHISLKRAAVVLAEELNYEKAASRLNTTPAELQRQISVLEDQLSLRLFQAGSQPTELTEEGTLLIGMFRKALMFHAGTTTE